MEFFISQLLLFGVDLKGNFLSASHFVYIVM